MLANYLKMAWKVLARRKFFTFVSLFGIGFTLTTMMVVVALGDQLLAPSYPETELNRTLLLERMRMYGDRSAWHSGPGYKFLERYARDLPGVERMSVYTNSDESVSFLNGRKLIFDRRYTDGEYWRILQFEFLEGAAYTELDDQNANRVVVINESVRRRLFGETTAVGKTIELDASEYRVVGVVRDVPWFRQTAAADIWMPLHTNSTSGWFDTLMGGCQAMFLLEPGADRSQVQAAFRERLTRVEFDDPERYHTIAGLPWTRLESLSNGMLGLNPEESAPRRLVLLAVLAGLLFMALPAINLVNINLSRIFERSGEIGVRKAFGAASPDLVLQFVVENVVLCLIGGALGIVGAVAVIKSAVLIPQVPVLSVQLNWRIFLWAFFLATIFGLLSGVWPAWKMSRQNPVDALKGGGS